MLIVLIGFCNSATLYLNLLRTYGWNNTVSMRTGLILAHGGEFSFAILIIAIAGGILNPNVGQTVLVAMDCDLQRCHLLLYCPRPER